jgi:predicted dehydrogenase
MRNFRWGILGPGKIARKFASSLPYSQTGILKAVASTNNLRAKEFARDYGAEWHFDSYEALVDSGQVDAIYVATPHSFHLRDSKFCLERGIPVLCEKPLSTRPEDSKYLIDLALEKKAFLMEGLWTCCLPSFRKALQWVAEGRIGDVVYAEANFGHPAPMDYSKRHFNPQLGGGVMKDIGIYPLALFIHLFGPGMQIQACGKRLENGVDAQVVFQGESKDGKANFQGMVSFLTATGSAASITGTKGRIVFEPQWFRPVKIRLEIGAVDAEIFDGTVPAFGFQFEADEVSRCVESGLLESTLWPHANSLEASRLIAEAENLF